MRPAQPLRPAVARASAGGPRLLVRRPHARAGRTGAFLVLRQAAAGVLLMIATAAVVVVLGLLAAAVGSSRVEHPATSVRTAGFPGPGFGSAGPAAAGPAAAESAG